MRPSDDQRLTHVGMGGWDLPPFNGSFYPQRVWKGFRKLEYYSRFFDFVEVNATFYNSSLNGASARRWLEDVADNKKFLFTIKLFRGFTHTYDATKEDVRAVHGLFKPLAEAGRLGGVVMQFPYSFINHREARTYLIRLSRVLQPHRLFVDVRHASWNTPLMHNFFQENKLHLINVDLPPVRQHIPFNALAWDGHAYFRMMGRNTITWNHSERDDRHDYLYNDEEIEHLLQWIEYVQRAVGTTFVVFHNDPKAQSLYNGFRLRHLLEHNKRFQIPENLRLKFPALEAISTSERSVLPLFAGAAENA